MTHRPADYESMDQPRQLIFELKQQSDALNRILEILESLLPESESDPVEVSEPEAEPIAEPVSVTTES